MKRWLHSNAVWPPMVSVITFAIAYGMVEAGIWFLEYASHHLGAPVNEDPGIANMRRGILIIAACLYAFYRIVRFHPVANLPYASWLRNSPWNASKPLPMGPVHPVWQDVVVIGLLCLLARRSAVENPFYPLIGFGLSYLIGMTIALLFTRSWQAGLVLGFMWPALVLPGLKPLPMIGVVVGLVVVIAFGYAESLRRFPWKKENANDPAVLQVKRRKSILETEIRIESMNESPSATTSSVGWPFAVLSPKSGRKPIAASTSFALSALFGWWSYCAFTALDVPPEFAIMLLPFGFFAALFRYAIYCNRIAPPFNIWSRLVTGRFIVQGYDQVFVTPLAVFVLAILGTVILRDSELWFRGKAACWIAVLWYVLLSGGPTLQKWILTGQHRYRPPGRVRSSKGSVIPI